MANFGLFQNAPQIQSPDLNQSNISGGMQADAGQMAKQQAMGLGVSPADIQMRAGLMQAQKANAAQAVSTRGNFGLAGAQRMAQAGNAGLSQNVINQGAQLRAQEQDRALQTYLQAASQKRASDLQAAGLSEQEAIAQANLEQQAQSANQGMSSKMFGMGLGLAEGGLTGGAMVSDERAKADAYVQGAQDGARQIAPTIVQQWTRPEVMAAVQRGDRVPMGGGDMWVPSERGYVPLSQAPVGTPVQEANDAPRMHASLVQQKAPPQQYTMYDTETGHPVDQAPPMQEASDARAKQPEVGANNAANAFMDTLQPRAFTWADKSVAPNPQAAQTPNLGVYAQDVERSPWGKAIVQNDPATGYKHLDVKALMGALAASAGETHRQQQEHDRRLAALEAAVRGKR